jgi:hypothetical protein
MSEKEELFTNDQNRLMSIAGWASNLAWVALVTYLILAALTVFMDQAIYRRFANGLDYWDMVRVEPLYYFLNIGADMLSRALSGFMCYVVLKGVSLGLYMVIETNMNYREKENQGGE